jgi:NADPH:quinone reductase-like Zn-dependent oxidoreductase
VIIGSEGRGRWLGGFDRNLRAVALSRLVSQRLRMLSSKPRQEDLQRMRELLEAGKVTPAIDRTYPLGEVPQAIRYLVHGRGGGGKVVITVLRRRCPRMPLPCPIGLCQVDARDPAPRGSPTR